MNNLSSTNASSDFINKYPSANFPIDIKTLTNQIISEAIPLSNALLYIKQLLDAIGDNKDSLWLQKEIKGYDENDELPQYRCIHSPLKFLCVSPVRKSQILSWEKLEYLDDIDVAKSFKKANTVYLRDSITIIESTWKEIKGISGIIEISDKQRELLEEWYASQLRPVNGRIARGWQEVSKAQIFNIFNIIKVRLLSLLNYLSSKYPEIYFEPMKSNANLVITGNNNPVNIIINSTINISEELADKLKSAGVTNSEIEELKNIIKSEPQKSASLKEKVNKWLKGLSLTADIVTVSQCLLPFLAL